MTNVVRSLALLSIFALLLLAGCNTNGIHPVRGQVVWKDTKQPASELANSLISFEQAETQTSARGQIKPDGTFQLTTNDENDGAKVGEHLVLLVEIGRLPLASDPTKLSPGKIPARYATPGTDLRATIKPGFNQPTIEVERLGK
ncbi:hypothetical protein [Anatilimnocola floriformis]|uniref:hypothetical protein n=1 Tax=Anatilimnocola floriformis TaxID=2948575 RepID=UPI0020C4A8A3|nr:hypothetical protein [Anatilimnocola floriformis]